MDWETTSLLAFIIIFSMWATSPSMDYNYTVIDGVKHYFLTEEIQTNASNLDQLTNSIFIKFDDPWSVYSVTSMLLAGIFVLLTFSRNQLTNTMKTTTKFFEDFNTNRKISSQAKSFYKINNLHLIHVSLKKRQFIKKYFSFFFISIFLLTGFSSSVFAATVEPVPVISGSVTTATDLHLGTTDTFSHTTNAGEDRLLVVSVATREEASDGVPDVTGVTYGGVAMTEAIDVVDIDELNLHIFTLLNPAE